MNALRKIEVVEHHVEWIEMFEAEVVGLRQVFGAVYVTSHHIGSTAVPGLNAKPTIDIALEVKSGTSIESFYPDMEKFGYTCRGECLDAVIPGIPGRYYFVRYNGPVHIVHTHVYEQGHSDIKEKIVFRDYLIVHPDVAAAYGQLKEKLASEFQFDNLGHMRGKDDFLKTAIFDAIQWGKEDA